MDSTLNTREKGSNNKTLIQEISFSLLLVIVNGYIHFYQQRERSVVEQTRKAVNRLSFSFKRYFIYKMLIDPILKIILACLIIKNYQKKVVYITI